jgi:prevent-host-death family protein
MRTHSAIAQAGQRPVADVQESKQDEKGNRFNQDGFVMVTSLDLNRHPAAALRQATEGTVVITRHQKTVAYLVSPDQWQRIERRIKELEFQVRSGEMLRGAL